ncbi:MAG: alpha/beta hydrolase family protein [Lysobacter sp.]
MKSNQSASCMLALLLASPWAMAQTLSADLFARHSEITDIALSPDGTRIAMAVPVAEGSETQLQIIPLDESSGALALRFGKQQHVTDIYWTTDQRLVVSRAEMEPLRAQPYSRGELIATNADGSDQELLFGYISDYFAKSGRRKDNGFSALTGLILDEPGMALVTFRCWNCGEEPDTVLFRVDTRTGDRKEIERFTGNTTFGADRSGMARIAVSYDKEDNPVIRYRPEADAKWQPLPRSLAGYSLTPLRFSDQQDVMYALVSDHREPERLYRMDLSAGTRTLLAGRDDMEIARVLYEGSRGAPYGVFFDAGKPTVEYIDKTSSWAALHAGLMQSFPGELVLPYDFSDDDSKLIFVTYSGRNPGAYYLLDRTGNKIRLLAETKPWIDSKEMAPVRPIEFKNRDGEILYGFYTALGSGPKPMVVVPHGGPHGPYDAWRYDSDVQFLASRGYAVLQVNFRGSGGRGQSFMEAGYREWGGKIQDDIADGVNWAVDQKLADSSRICIYGASFGGYAALMNPIRYPDTYRCAIGHVGVYDLQVMFKEGDIAARRSGRRYLERVLGADETVLIANSPARQVDQIKIPVMLAQGKIDRRVPMDQFESLTRAFKKSGRPAETLVVPGEGHGFYKPENQAKLYRMMAEFLDQHIGEDAEVADGETANASASID